MEYEDRYVHTLEYFYYPNYGFFVDTSCRVTHDIFEYVPPIIVEMFLDERAPYFVYEVNKNLIVEMFFEEADDPDNLLRWHQAVAKEDVWDRLDATDYNGPHINCLR